MELSIVLVFKAYSSKKMIKMDTGLIKKARVPGRLWSPKLSSVSVGAKENADKANANRKQPRNLRTEPLKKEKYRIINEKLSIAGRTAP